MARIISPAVVFLGLLVTGQARGAESFDACTHFIDSVPAVITSQGVWCLRKDVATASTTGAAISVYANNVTVDCNGFKLGGLAAGTATAATGVSSVDRLNTTVRDCKIRGFQTGIVMLGNSAAGHVAEDNLIEASTYIGMQVAGTGAVVRRNRVLDTGGSTLSYETARVAIGMALQGEVDATDNTVSGVSSILIGEFGLAIGITLHNSSASRIVGNQVRSVSVDGGGAVRGIDVNSSTRTNLSRNYLNSAGETGIRCESATNMAYDNHIAGFTTAVSGCTNTANWVSS